MKKILILIISLMVAMAMSSCVNTNNNDDIFGTGGDEEAAVLESPLILKDESNNIYWENIKNAIGYIVNINGIDEPVQTENELY